MTHECCRESGFFTVGDRPLPGRDSWCHVVAGNGVRGDPGLLDPAGQAVFPEGRDGRHRNQGGCRCHICWERTVSIGSERLASPVALPLLRALGDTQESVLHPAGDQPPPSWRVRAVTVGAGQAPTGTRSCSGPHESLHGSRREVLAEKCVALIALSSGSILWQHPLAVSAGSIPWQPEIGG